MANQSYDAPAREKHWQEVWEKDHIFHASNKDPRPKCYVLEMFPYPSGRIHVGHSRNYTMGDVFARYKRAKGFNVLHPMGWDAFGMPAENAAMEHKVHPAEWTYQNIDNMRRQLKSMGLSLDWSREIATCSPDYYRHQQKLFLDMLKKGLAYRKSSKVNWDPVDHTVLANEQVIDGRGWRSGALVEQRELTQWFFKITDYADELLEALQALDKWPEKVRLMQANWIGRSEGLLVRFALDKKTAPKGETEVEVYTTRPDTLFGAAFIALAPDHPLAKAAAENNPELAAFCEECRHMGTSVAELETAEKQGFDTGIRAVHPFDKNWTLPVYVANFILMDYGTGAIFGCPSGDQRDLDFARKYDLPFKPVILPPGEDAATFAIKDKAFDGDGTMINSSFLDGLSTKEAFEETARRLEKTKLAKRPVGARKVNYRLRDWGISRQRYWGCPIPVIHCEVCGTVPVPDADLPVELPKDATFDKPGNPLDRHPTWKYVKCPSCGGEARRETDTMDTFVDSSWYFVRFTGPHAKTPVDKEAAALLAAGRPVHRRHRARDPALALFALLHARHLRHRSSEADAERARAVQRAVHTGHGHPRDLQVAPWRLAAAEPGARRRRGRSRATLSRSRTGEHAVIGSVEKMSKSRKNTVDLDDFVNRYGADVARWFVLSDSPPERDVIYTDVGVDGARRFVQRIWRLVDQGTDTAATTGTAKPASFGPEATALRRASHKALDQVARSIESLRFNVAVAQVYEFTNVLGSALGKAGEDFAWAQREALEFLVQMIGPMMPHLAEESWARLGYNTLLANQAWPEADPALLVDDMITIAVQVNGKRRDELTIARTADSGEIEAAALRLEPVQRALEGRPVKKVIVVPQRIVNVVG